MFAMRGGLEKYAFTFGMQRSMASPLFLRGRATECENEGIRNEFSKVMADLCGGFCCGDAAGHHETRRRGAREGGNV